MNQVITRSKRSLLKAVGVALAAPWALVGCSSPSVDDYALELPVFDLKEYFSGRVTGHGMFVDLSAKVTRRFVVEMNNQWQGNKGVLDEDFVFSDGEKQKRVWTLQHLGNGQYEGTAADVEGVAKGQSRGNAFRMKYVLRLPYQGRLINVDMDDWMYQISDSVVLNRTRMSKFGIEIGEVILSFQK